MSWLVLLAFMLLVYALVAFAHDPLCNCLLRDRHHYTLPDMRVSPSAHRASRASPADGRRWGGPTRDGRCRLRPGECRWKSGRLRCRGDKGAA